MSRRQNVTERDGTPGRVTPGAETRSRLSVTQSEEGGEGPPSSPGGAASKWQIIMRRRRRSVGR